MQTRIFSSLPSTNQYALDLLDEGLHGEIAILALEQSEGRGQHGRSFASPPGGLYFSLVVRPRLAPQYLPLVTLAAGVGSVAALENFCGIIPALKWPNDLYLEERKLGGILTESEPLSGRDRPAVVIGIGINVTPPAGSIPPELARHITCLAEHCAPAPTPEDLFHRCIDGVRSAITTLEQEREKLLAQWSAHDYLKGRRLRWEDGETVREGLGQGLLSDGRYALLDQHGTHHAILAGRVTPLPDQIAG